MYILKNNNWLEFKVKVRVKTLKTASVHITVSLIDILREENKDAKKKFSFKFYISVALASILYWAFQ